MATMNCQDPAQLLSPQTAGNSSFDFSDFEAELKRLSAAQQELLDICHPNEIEDHPVAISVPMSQMMAELQRLSAANRDLMDEIGSQGQEPAIYSPRSGARASQLPAPAENVPQPIHQREPAKPAQESSSAPAGEELWLERQREYETLLEEKSEVIRTLHLRIHELEEERNARPAPSADDDHAEVSEAMRLKQELENQRHLLRQDEDDVMAQLRQMEMTMAKERAEMARQRQEINRLQTEVMREIEMASRDPGLRERLQHLREGSRATPAPTQTPIAALPSEAIPAASAPERKSSSFFRRMFGS